MGRTVPFKHRYLTQAAMSDIDVIVHVTGTDGLSKGSAKGFTKG